MRIPVCGDLSAAVKLPVLRLPPGLVALPGAALELDLGPDERQAVSRALRIDGDQVLLMPDRHRGIGTVARVAGIRRLPRGDQMWVRLEGTARAQIAEPLSDQKRVPPHDVRLAL